MIRHLILAAFLSLSIPSLYAGPVTSKQIRPERELLITDPAVVDSPTAQYPGAWSFGALIEQLAGKENASKCVREWLETWSKEQTIEGHKISPRPGITDRIILPWQRRDGFTPASGVIWEPKLENAPFRLLAIVNRMDLCAPMVANTVGELQREWKNLGLEEQFLALLSETDAGINTGQSSGYGGGNPALFAGEGRLIFGAMDTAGQPLAGDWTVIFEYHLPITDTRGVREWAEWWHAMALFAPSDRRFLTMLETLTRSFTDSPNHTSGEGLLAQLRTSEAVFGKDREFRQFRLSSSTFVPMPLSLTPSPEFGRRNSAEQRFLSEFLYRRGNLILSGLHRLPGQFKYRNKLISVLAGNAIIPASQPDFHWETTNLVPSEVRRTFSLNTCNGCHAGETGCNDGLHVHNRAPGAASQVSSFLRTDGATLRLNDPDVRGRKVEYREMEDRATILAALLDPKDRSLLDALRDVLRSRLQRTH